MTEKKQTGVARVRQGELKEGMRLAEDLKGTNGRLILTKGTAITTKELRIIKMWGIPEAFIVDEGGTPEEDVQPLDAVSFEKLQAVVDEHFRFTDLSHEVNRELHRLCLRHNMESVDRLIAPKEFKEKTETSETWEEYDTLLPEDVNERIENVKLPSLPAIVMRINEAIKHPKCTATRIADIISKDSSLSARLLKMVNSSFYSFPKEITSIARAVTIIGTRQLSVLAVGSVVVSTFKNIPAEIMDMESFWKHSIACGLIARILSSYKKNTNTENYFLAGLLHDIGRLVIFRSFPEYGAKIFQRATREPELLGDLEEELLGINHARLGGLLIKEWKLSPVFEYSCQYHHNPLDSHDSAMASIIHVANIIANGMYFGSSGDCYVPPLEPKAWESIGLPVSILETTVTQTAQLLNETVRNYMPGSN
ncbi:MAG: HDOD domain-containing protein [bacterium]|nr:HDOD domain-containing protein [bacterium]